MLVHDVFHACYLRLYKDDHRKKPPPVPELDSEGEPAWEVDRVLDHKLSINKRGTHKLEYLLRFTGYGPAEDCCVEVVSDCPVCVQEYWDRKPVTERLHASVCVAF